MKQVYCAMKCILATLVLGLVVSSCATILTGSDQQVTVNSNVEGAAVFINGVQVGTTPFSGKIKRDKEPKIMVSKKGYKSQTRTPKTSIASTFWVNIFSGGVFGSTTDLASGAMWEYDPGSFYFNLASESAKQGYNYEFDNQIKRFSMQRYSRLGTELAQRGGESITALYQVFSSKGLKKGPFVSALNKAYSASKNDAVKFGEAVSNLYFVKN